MEEGASSAKASWRRWQSPQPWMGGEARSGHAQSGALRARSFAQPGESLSPPASLDSRAQRGFPALTSAGDDLSAREAGEVRRAKAGEERARGAGRLRAPPSSADLSQWAPPLAPPPPSNSMKGAAGGKVRAESELQLDDWSLANSRVSRESAPCSRSRTQHEPREKNRHAPGDRCRRGLPL